MKKVLVTGDAGFIGCHLANYLHEAGYEVIGIDLGTPAHPRRYKFYTMDLQSSQVEEIIETHRPDACIHCAGPASVANSLAFLENDFKLTILPTFNILNAIKKFHHGCKFIYLSSAAVYGNPQILPVTELHPPKPISPYGFHKKTAENICEQFSTLYKIPVAVLRIFSAYGRGLKKQLLWDLCNKAMQAQEAIELFGTGEETRDFIEIRDLVKTIRLVLENTSFDFEVYNIANGFQVKIKDIATLLLQELGRFGTVPRLTFNRQTRPGDPLFWFADISRIKAMGYNQQIELSEGVRDYVEWFRQIN